MAIIAYSVKVDWTKSPKKSSEPVIIFVGMRHLEFMFGCKFKKLCILEYFESPVIMTISRQKKSSDVHPLYVYEHPWNLGTYMYTPKKYMYAHPWNVYVNPWNVGTHP